MTPMQLSLMDYERVAQARRHDPRTAKQAAAQNRDGRASQAVRILRHVREFGSITADQAHRELTMSDEDVTRGEWSTRIGTLIKRGLLERAGEVDERGRRGEVRSVLAYRLTREGMAETQRIWGVDVIVPVSRAWDAPSGPTRWRCTDCRRTVAPDHRCCALCGGSGSRLVDDGPIPCPQCKGAS